MLIFGYRLQLWQCIEASCLTAPLCGAVTGFTFVVQHKMAKNLRMVLCCQNQVSKGINQHYGLHVSACISVHSALVMVLGLLKKKKKQSEENGVFAVFRVAT